MAGNVYKSPLTPAVFHILLALSTQNRHGYGIMKQVEMDSEGVVTMGPGTLYGSISRMIEAGLICEAEPDELESKDGERRIYYTITSSGTTLLQTEISRLRQIIKRAKKIKLAGVKLQII